MKKREIGVSEAADILGFTDRYIREAVATGKIKGVKVGKKWFIDEESVQAFAKSRLNGTTGVPVRVPEVAEHVPVNTSDCADDASAPNPPQKYSNGKEVLTANEFPTLRKLFANQKPTAGNKEILAWLI